MPITNISDTARWVAVYRAMESARPDALFRDPYAEGLAGERGRAIVREMKGGTRAAWAMIVRTAVLDELILDRVRNGGVDTVINLAAGLDTRPWRLPLPATLQWFDVDLPEMIEYKTTFMRGTPTVCRYEAVVADLTDAAVRVDVLRRLGGVARTALVVTEGLLIYLAEEQVRALARSLHDAGSIRWWVSDVSNPMLLAWMNKQWGSVVDKGRAPFRFAPADSAAFFASVGWRELQFRSGLSEARRLKREMRMMWFWRLLSRFTPRAKRIETRRMVGYVLLERA